jgi:hypothetical protein
MLVPVRDASASIAACSSGGRVRGTKSAAGSVDIVVHSTFASLFCQKASWRSRTSATSSVDHAA